MLTLYENLFLVGLHEEKVAPIPSAESALRVGLAGAMLAEMAFRNRIETDLKQRVKIVNPEPTGEPPLDDALAKIQANSSHKKISYWLGELSAKPERLTKSLFQQLIEKGVLKEEDDEYSWLKPYPADSALQTNAKFTLKQRLRLIGLAEDTPDLPELALLSLLRACGKLDLVFLKDERKTVSRLIYELLVSEALKESNVQIIQEIEAAVESRIDSD